MPRHSHCYVMPRHRKANARDSFCPLANAGMRANTEWRKQLLKKIQQLRQAGRFRFPIYPYIRSVVQPGLKCVIDIIELRYKLYTLTLRLVERQYDSNLETAYYS